jgi:hypothetical protein
MGCGGPVRIRTVKPEFWQSEGVASVSREIRTLALGLLNLADDEGYFRSHPGVIAGQLFPYDADGFEFVRGSLPELVSAEWIELDPGSGLGRVRKFSDHQRVDKPRPSLLKKKWGIQEPSKKPPRIVVDASKEEGNGMEGKGREWKDRVRKVRTPPDPRHQPLTQAMTEHARSIDPGWAFGNGRDARAVTELLSLAGEGGPLEVLKRWKVAWSRSDFPRVRSPHELVPNWGHFGADPPGAAVNGTLCADGVRRDLTKGATRAEWFAGMSTNGPNGETDF